MPMHAVHEYYMTFYLRDQLCDHEGADGKVTRRSNSLTTIFTKTNGCTYWKGDFALFCVQLKSNGLFTIFGIPQRLMLDNIYPLEDLLGSDSPLLTAQLYDCSNIYEMGNLMNAYLTKKFLERKHNGYTGKMAAISDEILKYKGSIMLDRLSDGANMSFRNFERHFIDEIGVSPKLYARIVRFYNATQNKMLHPEKSWTDIACENGYYDQAHFIKETKMFAAKTPEELFNTTPPPKEQYIEMPEG